MIQFFAPDIARTLTLPESDSQHCVRVLRMQPGDMLEVTDGAGHRHRCRLVDAHQKRALVEIVSTETILPGWSQEITVCVAPTKHMDRMEWMVEKMTEIGVNRIIPLLCDRSERRELKVERLEKIAVSAMKQSLKAHLPIIDALTPLRQVAALMPEAQRFVGYCDPSVPRRELSHIYSPHKDTMILIGPEGDFTPAEVSLMLEAGIVPATFGDNRLRTETAALYALSACHVIDSSHSPEH